MTTIKPEAYEPTRQFKQPIHFFALAVDRRETRLYAAGADRAIYVFDLESESTEPLARWSGHTSYVSALLAPGASSDLLVSCAYDRRLLWWNTATGELIHVVEAHKGWARDLAAADDAPWLASVGDDMAVHLWDAASADRLASLSAHAQRTPQAHVTALYVVAVSDDGRHLAAADRTGEVRVWDVASRRVIAEISAPTLYTYDPVQRKRSIGGVRSLAFSHDGERLAMGGIGQIENVDGFAGPIHVELWDWQTQTQLGAFHGKDNSRGIVNDLAFAPDDAWLAGVGGGSDDGFLAFWDPAKPSDPVRQEKISGHLHRIRLGRDARRLYLAGFEEASVWSANG